MIIPTPEFDPLFAEDGVPFRTKMTQYMEREFGDLLGERSQLVHSDRGLEVLSTNIASQLQGNRSSHAA